MASAPLLQPAPGAVRPKRPAPVLEIAPYSYAQARALERELGVSHTLGQILTRRGFGDPAEAAAWLRADVAHDPSQFTGMGDACELVLRHVRAGTRITVHGDYDVDGVCSTAILVRTLRGLGGEVDWLLPSRRDDGYGLSLGTVERLAARGTRLLITVDCGITSVEEVAAARAAGLDVLVTDHHSPRADGVLPDAPIVHPAVSGYPCADLCAAAVAYKLAGALAEAAGGQVADADEDLDLVALATLADVVPLRGENRRLVREGLRALSLTARPGLRALMRVAQVDPSRVDASAVGFRLAPRINAAGRLHRADAGVELMLTSDEVRAAAIADELDAANGERRAVEQRMRWEAEALVAELGDRSAYVLAGEGWHPGVSGIVASRIAEQWHRPAILIALDGQPLVTGSGRSIPGFDLLGALHHAAPVLTRYGGHRAAAGLTVEAGRIGELREAVEAHAASVLEPGDLVPRRRGDAVVPGPALGLELAEELARLEPCGAGNPGINLLVAAARCADVRPMGEGRHARFSLEAGATRSRAVAFGCDGQAPGGGAALVDALVELECHEWNGAEEPRLIVRDARPTRPAPIRVVGEPEPGEPWLAAVLAEVDAAPVPARPPEAATAARARIDRRGEGGSGVLADLVASAEPTLAVCADVPRRHAGLATRVGGFALCSWAALAREPGLAGPFTHVVALDPPASAVEEAAAAAARPGGEDGFTHLAWGEPELRFRLHILELELDLRASLAALYRSLRDRGGAAGEEAEEVLRGAGAHGRSATLAGRLVRVLTELGLVTLDRDGPALAVVPGAERTELERSAAFRGYTQQLEDGRRFLTSATAGPR